MPKIKAVIFDLDGTLIDGSEIVLGAFKHTLKVHGRPYDDQKVRALIGRILEDQYEIHAPGQDSKMLADFHRAWQAENRHLYKTFPGCDELMKWLQKKTIKIAAYTSAARSRTDIALESMHMRQFFDFILCGDEVTKPKPDGEGVLILAKKLQLSTDELVMVGDAEHDILSGKNAGVITIGITHGFGTRESIEKAKPDYTVDNLAELQVLLEKLAS